jgi:enamine deaminase RidA (YjgF/YER057c/UK114 family)
MSLERIDPPELPRPSGYTHAVAGTGRTVFLAGQTGTDAAGRIVAAGVAAQFEQALANLLVALRAAGGEPEHLAQLTIYIVDMDAYRDHAREIGAGWRRLMGRVYPATAAVGVPRLWDPAALVELQGTALVPPA